MPPTEAVQSGAMIWWLILYWPIMGTLIFTGNQIAKRYPADSIQRGRVEMALGCGIIAMPA
jgi:hypothetical protein